MKKILLILSLLFTSSLFSWDTILHNATKYQIKATVYYSLCDEVNYILAQGETTTAKSGCCIKYVVFRGNNPADGLTRTDELGGKNTGFGISCADNEYTVVCPDGSKNLIGTSIKGFSGYKLSFSNETDSGMKIAVGYTVCNDTVSYAGPRNNPEAKPVDIGICCVSVIKVTGQNGRFKDKVKRIEPSFCGSAKIIIKQNKNGDDFDIIY